MPSEAREKTGSPDAKPSRPGPFFAPYGSRFGSPRCPENGDVHQSCKKQKKSPLSGWKAVLLWLRGLDLNQRPPGYELRWVSPSAVPQCFPDHFRPEIAQNPKVVPLRSGAILREMGQCLGRPLRSSRREITLVFRHVGHMVYRGPVGDLPADDGNRLWIFQAV